MSIYSKGLTTDQSRSLPELCALVTCPFCHTWLRPTWWSRGRFAADLVKACDECLIYYLVRFTHVIEETPMASE